MGISADQYRQLGKTRLRVPPIVFGTSALADQRRTIPDQTKREMCVEWFRHVEPPVVIDTAGRYGAGRALEMIGRFLDRLEIGRDEVIIGNRLGWASGASTEIPLPLGEGSMGAHSVAVPRISYDGMIECWEEGRRLLGATYATQLVSVDAPDRYLASVDLPTDRDQRFQDILDAYRALRELKRHGRVVGVGVVASDWRVVKKILSVVELDWVMLCGSLTIMGHPPEVLDFVADLAERQISVINSGLFHGGFLAGCNSFDGRARRPDDPAGQRLLAWRKSFVALCEGHGVRPADACIQFGLSAPGVVAVAVDTSRPDRVAANVDAVAMAIPGAFWDSMKEEGLIAEDYPYV